MNAKLTAAVLIVAAVCFAAIVIAGEICAAFGYGR